jgi:hypothetical protein
MIKPLVTYLFGAGASANKLPPIAKLPEELLEFQKGLNAATVIEKHESSRLELINDIEAILAELIADPPQGKNLFPSIDELAREKWRRKSQHYEKLKTVLSLFFTYKQRDNEVDLRYKTFWNRVLEQPSTPPRNLKCLTWNYDKQLERAFALTNSTDYHTGLGVLSKNIYPRLSNLHASFMPTAEGTTVFKMNGTASVYHSRTGEEAVFELGNPYDDLCDKYLGCKKFYRSAVSFGWDSEDVGLGFEGTLNLAIQATKDSRVLIIIGYSLPHYNRSIDRALVHSMSKLERVIIQDPNSDDLRDVFTRDFGFQNVITVRKHDQFEIPFELM